MSQVDHYLLKKRKKKEKKCIPLSAKLNRWTNRSQCFSHVTTSLGMSAASALLSGWQIHQVWVQLEGLRRVRWSSVCSHPGPVLRSVERGEFPVPLGAPACAFAQRSGHARSCCLRPLWTSQTQAQCNNQTFSIVQLHSVWSLLCFCFLSSKRTMAYDELGQRIR